MDLVKRHNSSLGLGDYHGYTWDWDQKILSRIILESGLCTVPSRNKIWDVVQMHPPIKDFSDNRTCFHGMKVRDYWIFDRLWEKPTCKNIH